MANNELNDPNYTWNNSSLNVDNATRFSATYPQTPSFADMESVFMSSHTQEISFPPPPPSFELSEYQSLSSSSDPAKSQASTSAQRPASAIQQAIVVKPPAVLPEASNSKKAKKAKVKKYECPQCDKRFTRRYHLQRHLDSHTGKRRYPCPACWKRFARQENLVRHLKTHTPEPASSLICDECGIRMATKSGLKKHRLRHQDTGNNLDVLSLEHFLVPGGKSECDFCNESFSDCKTARFHTALHEKEYPFKCVVCCQSFKTRASLASHSHDSIGRIHLEARIEQLYDYSKALERELEAYRENGK